jgi:HD-GYP domain-containing protein (c-di-GMP phosphodiesterase class II)
MLNSIEYLRPALDIPYLHHEKWDGSGYPLGLKGEDIPISARLFAFIDVFDALTNDRPYRPAWSVQEAIAFIEENSGIHFDPNITPIFISMIRDEMDS